MGALISKSISLAWTPGEQGRCRASMCPCGAATTWGQQEPEAEGRVKGTLQFFGSTGSEFRCNRLPCKGPGVTFVTFQTPGTGKVPKTGTEHSPTQMLITVLRMLWGNPPQCSPGESTSCHPSSWEPHSSHDPFPSGNPFLVGTSSRKHLRGPVLKGEGGGCGAGDPLLVARQC